MDLTWVHMAEAIIVEVKEIQSRIIQLEAENEELRRENKRMGEVIKPQPCTKFRDAERMAWIAKLVEETNEVVQEAEIIEENWCSISATDRLAEELTDVITVCVSWLDALGYDEYLRGEVQKRVNEKNRERGYF